MRTLRTLNLSAVGLSGALPQELGNLDSLEVLRLDTNRLVGSLEAVFCTLNGTSARQAYRLRELRVNNNRLTGQIPPCIVEFKQLEIVHFQQNQFTGGIPERIVELTALRELLLAQNRLTGALPRSFNRAFTGKTARTSALAALERLDIAGNGFTGALPQGVGEFTALRELRLNDNAFAGALPQGLVALNRLETLDASRNRFTGALPESIGNMRRLRQLSLTNNLLGGTIPESLGECDLLERLELDSNALEGAVPTALATWQNLRVVGLSNNRLTSVPTLTVALTSSRVPFEALRLGGNRLTFESIEDNAALRNSTYSPQDSVGTSQNLTFQPATRIALSLTVGGTSNRYQWFKNGSTLGAASASGEFTISERATEAENGTYQCRITNPRAPALTLQSRTWQIRVDSAARQPSQPNAVAQPILTYPPNNARFMPYSLDLRWKSAEGASEYEVQISTNASFSPILRATTLRTTTFSVSLLQPSQRYVWRVRSLAADGGKSVWSQALFTTANIERPLQMSSIDFERVPLRETSIKEASVSNFSTVPQILNDITILSEAPNDTTSPFRILDDVRGIVIPAGESLTVRISFTPLVLGNTSATSILAFQQRPQDGARRDSTRNILQGIGGAMKLDDVDFDTVRAGGTTIRSANLVNLSSRRITLKSPTIPIQTQENVFSIESFFGLGDITLNPLDTVQVVVRCRVPESSIGRKLAGVLVFGEGDSVRASVRAIARALRPNDIVANISVQPREDNIPPGGAVDLDVMLTTNDITPANISQVFRAIQPQFRGRFRMNRQVLTLDASEKVAQSQVSGDILSVVIPQTGLERIPADESKRSTRLVRIAARAVAGSTNATRLVLENAALAPPLIRGSSAVFIEESGVAGTFTARISQAGGKRLIGSVPSGKLLVKSL
jgi:Leucine-rich repeat (LRR) protein